MKPSLNGSKRGNRRKAKGVEVKYNSFEYFAIIRSRKLRRGHGVKEALFYFDL